MSSCSYGLSKLLAEQSADMVARAQTAPRPGEEEDTRTSFASLRFTNIVKREAWGALPW